MDYIIRLLYYLPKGNERLSRKNWKAIMGENKIRRRNQKSGIRKQSYESREWRLKDVVKREITISFTKRVYEEVWVSRFEKCVKWVSKYLEKCVIRLLYYLPMERMSEEEFINNIDWHITSLKNLDNKALKILVGKLEEENKKLKSDLAFERTMLDNVKAEYKSLQNVIKKLEAELSKYKKQYEHSMWEDNELIYEEWLYD